MRDGRQVVATEIETFQFSVEKESGLSNFCTLLQLEVGRSKENVKDKICESNLLVQSAEGIRLDRRQLVLVDGQNLQSVQSLERPVVDYRNSIVIQVQDQQVMQILQGARRNRQQLVLGNIQLRQTASCGMGREKQDENTGLEMEAIFILFLCNTIYCYGIVARRRKAKTIPISKFVCLFPFHPSGSDL